ncbi:T9SS type A sorting domain-containing protein [Reichenbachiella carrageenanivorans]|uniref:T9SS type A sorting domain-containing protein n=1 Tax=Reichenbachiella carrageenanivorans TaxID=2979869 RepID=A0ABY6D6G6_9BACT|nr:T9SS type A sorting domain-containing protein [Reichenbachiella carrageenanivorans]UXX80668.1 T9SS type A sorting domain-containing protein [Reichenbachiella carrageenanivorans]
MKSSILAVLIVFNSWAVRAQFETKNTYTGTWSDTGSWTAGQPNPLTTNIDDEANIYGYITREGSLSFTNIGNNSDEIIIYDTLVVEGNMTFETNSISLKVETGGLLVIFGDFVANNKVDLENGGTMVITGDMTLSGGQQDYIDNGGGLYVDGDIIGNGDTSEADNVDRPSSDLNSGNSEEQSLYEFIQSGGSKALPITLGKFEVKSIEKGVQLMWTTLSEENFDYFEIYRSADGSNFEVIGEMKGQGFTSESMDYLFVDESPLYGLGYYRLNAIDFDGSSEMFAVVKVSHSPTYLKPSVYPNPTQGQNLSIQMNYTEAPINQHLVISNYEGKVVFESSESQSLQKINLQGLKSGLYFVKIQIDNLIFKEKLLID